VSDEILVAGPMAGPDAAEWRRWLAAYPRGWRDEHGEALIGVSLDVAEAAGRTGPTRVEVADLVANGLATRMRWALPSQRVLGTAAWFAVVLGGGIALTALSLGELAAPYRPFWAFYDSRPGFWGPFQTTGPVLYALWLLALGAVTVDAVRVARWLLTASCVVALALLPVSAAFGVNRPPQQLLFLLAWCAALGAAGLRRSGWTVSAPALGGAGALVTAAVLVTGGPPVLLPPGSTVGPSTWDDAYQTFPFYRGVSGTVVGIALAIGLVLTIVATVVARRVHVLLALLLVTPAALPWSGWTRQPTMPAWVYQYYGGHPLDELWLWVALLAPAVALVADRAMRLRHRGPGRGAAPHPG
jgi:hypothetical protein